VSEALRHSALLTDLYELTMAAAYFENGFRANASFELFVRSLPPQRGYLLAAGLEQALDFLEDVRFPARGHQLPSSALCVRSRQRRFLRLPENLPLHG